VASAIAVGLVAGLASGLLGVGGGIVMIPLLVVVVHLTQHHAHATSLAAIVLIAASGTIRFALDGSVDWGVAGLLAAGTLIGAPFGAATLDRIKERPLKISFGITGLIVAIFLVIAPGA
jgi:uncharacterized membrane protein YfcA